LKTQAIVELERLEEAGRARDPAGPAGLAPQVLDLLAGFRAAAVEQLRDRLDRLDRRQPFGVLAVSGGVAANRLLRRSLAEWAAARGVELVLVPLAFAGDNAAMIAHAALVRERRGEADDPFAAEAASRIPL
jgi:N6-L-threonylcarbamoyladenine synthase